MSPIISFVKPSSRSTHDENQQQIQPHRAVREPSVVLQRAHLPDDHTDDRPDEDADGEAELVADCDLRDGLRVAEADGADLSGGGASDES